MRSTGSHTQRKLRSKKNPWIGRKEKKMNTHNIGQVFTWTLFAEEFVSMMYDLRWAVAFCIVLIATDFWWGWRESKMYHRNAVGKEEKNKYRFRFSTAGRRTLNKFVDYTTYLLVGGIAGLAITEPLGVCSHTVSAAIGIGFGCLFELSSIVGHVAAVRGINIKLNLKNLLVAIFKRKSEALGEIIDESIEEIEDNRKENKEDEA